MSEQSSAPSASEGGTLWPECGPDLNTCRRRRIAARRSGWVGGMPARHGVADHPRCGFHRCTPWGHSRRFDHTHPWHRRDWLRQIADQSSDDGPSFRE